MKKIISARASVFGDHEYTLGAKLHHRSKSVRIAAVLCLEHGGMLKEGEAAPAFDLPDPDMEMVSLSSFTGRKNVVLYFYPKDDTPGCTLEAIAFSELEDAFSSLQTVILGVSMDDCMSHGSFRDKHGLTVQLLADTDGDVCKKYGVLHEKEVEGKKKTAV